MSVADRLADLSPEQRALFEKLREKQRKAAAQFPQRAQPPPVPRVSGPTGEGDWPLSLDQERFWFMEQLYPGGAGLNISAASRMRGPLSVPAVAAALDEIVRRHAAWRTAFPVLDGTPVQRVAAPRSQPLALLDLSGLPGERKEPEVLRLLTAATAAPFALETGPLVRSALVRLGPRDHVCILTVHHLVTDWISFQNAFAELAAIYAGRSAALPPPPIHYPDFALWQRSWLQGEILDGLVSWWREQLAGFPLALELPTDRPRPAVVRGRGGRRVVHASRELSEAVRSLARREGATLFMAVLAATAALLHRLSGQEKLILGANNANRNRPELEPVLGCFLTQVPFPIDLTGDPTFRELLARVRKSALGALAHQDLPFGKLVEAIQPERDTSRQPLVQALVQVLDGQASKAELAGVEFEPVDAHDGNARYDLMLTLFDYPEGLAGSLEHDSDLFDSTTAERLAGLLFLQMESAAADPELRLSELPVLSGDARHQALVEWNDTARPLPGWTLPERFAAQAARTPDAVAVIAGHERLTYGEIDRRSDDLARRLHVEPGSRVALLLGRTPDVPVAILAAWKAGAAYIPLDPEWPAGRLETVLADAEPALLVHRGPLPAALDVPALDLDAPGSPGETELPGFRSDRLAYLIYTSGTTGRPKAVMVEHGSVAAMVGAILDRIGVRPDERVPHLSRYTFDVSLLEIFVPLLSGGACEIVESDEVLDPAGFLDVLERSTRVFTVPALLRRAAAAAKDCGPQRFAGLRTLTSGGDLAAPDLLEELLAAFPSTDILVLYGPTETSIICTGHRLSRTRQPERSLIGRPLDGVEVWVMDSRGQPVPLGVPGELWIGGPGVARGYFRRADLTAERFVEVDGRRFYRTGDLVRQVPSEGGELEFLGRVDDQVKVRGFRIEPGEIEAALLDHPEVRDVTVVALPAGGDKQLVAYVVGTDDTEALRTFLGGRLPDYMLPAAFVPLDALPISAHGKVDRKALPAPGAARETGSAAPRNAREELLAGIWREALGLERVGIHDNFFQLGGDSILSIQVVARARRAGLQLTTRQFFDNQTIAGLAAVAGIAEERVVEERVEGEVPLTPVQRRFFAEGRREPWRFNQAVLLASRERLERAPIAAALERLARHHDALRLRFVEEADGWHQRYAPAAPVPLLEVDLPPEALEAAVEQLQSGLDLQHGPLFTAALFHLGAEDRLLLTAHHLIVDAVSWRVLLEDLTAEKLPPKTTSWKRWAELLAASSSEEEIPYWQAIPTVPPLPVDAHGEGGRATLTVELGAAETRALLQDAPEVYRTQANDLLLAALACAFVAWTGEDTLLVDLEGHGREEIFPGVDLSRTVGWFTTLFPVALRLGPGAGPRESILAVKETLRAVPGRGLGFGLLKGLLRERLSVPEPQVSFNYLGRFDAPAGEGPFTFAPEAVRGTEGEAVPGRHLFALDLLVLEDRLRATWTYGPGRHLPATAERLARGFLAELEALVAHCLAPEAGGWSPSDFPLAGLDQAALDRLVGNDRGVEDLYPLAPLQEGILFHTLYVAGSDLYFEQFVAGIEGALDAPAFAAAWQRVVDRHPALRTAFLWQGIERPLQLVRREAELPWTAEDWRGLPAADLEARWRDLLAADRARGFDLARAPLLRLTLVRTGEQSHRLIWSSHHLIFDGWCLPILLSEVFALLQAEPRLPPPPRPYRDYIAWLAGRDPAEAESYWRQALRGFTEPTALPFDHPGAPAGRRADDYFERSVTLPAGPLQALAQRLQVTLNTLVQGAWAILLSHYARTADVVFGGVVSGRPAELPGVESMVGLFINSLPVRVEVPEREAASAWLARLQTSQVELRQFEWTPLAHIQSLARLPAGQPLFASLLTFENYPVDPSVSERLGELRITDASLAERTNYPLTLIVVARGHLEVRLVADRRFEPVTVERMLAHLESLLQGLAANPGRPPLSLPFLGEAERHQLTVEWNDTAFPLPSRATIHGLFAAQAALRPEAVAVEHGEERLTYGELARRAGRLARHLRALGLQPEERVAVLAERAPDMIAALLGILEAGGVYLPLDPTHPAERLAWMIRDAGATRLVAAPATAIELPDRIQLVAWDAGEDAAEPGGELPGGELPDVPAASLAYVLYTSGSTGTPKGVAVTHRNVIRLLWGADYADLGPEQVWLQYSPVAFDLSTLEIWAPLLHGGRLVLFPGRLGSLAELAAVIERHGVTAAWLTAGLFHEMVDGRVEGLRPLSQLLAGGDVVSPDHARRALSACPGLTLIDGYGPTESTTFTSCHRMTGPRQVGETVPIGRPIVNTRTHVLDGGMRPVPVGVWGELYAGGEGLARGYLARPALTAERFLPDPFSGSGERLYRTGDLARWRADGVLEFLGRLDSQLKIRGFRVEPAEVEAALLACPGVRRAAVVALGEAAGKSLAAFWTGEAEMDDLRTALRSRLPEPMVPSVFLPVADLPLTPNGKVDRRALAALATVARDAGAARPTGERVAPRTPLEENLVEAWAAVLGRDPGTIGALDNFFELGGHSLLATRLMSLLQARWGIDVPLQLLFDTPHLAGLADGIMERELREADGELLASMLAELGQENLP